MESGPLAGAKRPEKGRKPEEEAEPVDHFGEWTTSWDEKPGQWLEPWDSVRASGPL